MSPLFPPLWTTRPCFPCRSAVDFRYGNRESRFGLRLRGLLRMDDDDVPHLAETKHALARHWGAYAQADYATQALCG